MFEPDHVRFVLVGPRSSGNVGAAARALKNFGFSRLDLVAPRCEPRDDEARRFAVDALDVLDRAVVHDDLDACLRTSTTVVGTSRRRGRYRKPHFRLDEVVPALVRDAVRGELGIVFGREDSGLRDTELDRCTHLVHLPSAAAYPSLNLAQAVLLTAYELRRSAQIDDAPPAPPDPPAPHEEREAMYGHLERALAAIGYLSRDTHEPIMRRFRRALNRAELSAHEVKMLRGVARQVLWAASRAGLEIPRDEADDPPRDGDRCTRRS